MELKSKYKNFDGFVESYSHQSTSCNCPMNFSIFLPPQAQQKKVPALYWLSGLTCTDQNFITKAGAQKLASELGIALIAPDTSPREVNLAGEDDSWDFGSGAGFYLDATQQPWSQYYNMYSYITEELPKLIESSFPITSKKSISGHSMGGHGALVISLRNPQTYTSTSAFSPICAPSTSPWGIKAFSNYLGDNKEEWQKYDAHILAKKASSNVGDFLIDQGTSDDFLEKELLPHMFEKSCKENNINLNLRMQPGYDHSYYFISTFIEDHLRFHAEKLLVQ